MSEIKMELGLIGNVTFGGRKFRWFVSATSGNKTMKPTRAKVSKRPTLDIHAEVDYLKHITWIHEWETVETLFYTPIEELKELWDLSEYIEESHESATVVLSLYDGVSNLLETWTLSEAYPQFTDIGIDDEVRVTWRYKECVYKNESAPFLACTIPQPPEPIPPLDSAPTASTS